MEQLLREYAEIQREKAQFIAENIEAFNRLQMFDQSIAEKEGEIKEAARLTKEDTEKFGVMVRVARKFKKWYDAKTLTPEDRKTLMANDGLIIDVVPKVFETLVRDGLISAESRAQAYREEEGTPAVTIKYKGE